MGVGRVFHHFTKYILLFLASSLLLTSVDDSVFDYVESKAEIVLMTVYREVLLGQQNKVNIKMLS